MKKQNMKKFTALAAAAVLAACAVAPSVGFLPASATANKITFVQPTGNNDTATHTYKAYQIFSGTVGDDGTLTNIQWANTEKGSSFLTDLKASNASYTQKSSSGDTSSSTLGSAFTNCESAAAVAAVLAAEGSDTSGTPLDSSLLQAFATFAASQTADLKEVNSTASAEIDISATGDGYYLIMDDTMTTSDTTAGAKTRYILRQIEAADGLEVTTKNSLPTVEKKVKENTKVVTYGSDTMETETTVNSNYNDVADYNIGDTVPFELIGTLPSTYNDYSKYKYVFNDTLGKEFTYTSDSANFEVTVVQDSTTYYVKTETSTNADDGYVLSAPAGGNNDQTMTVTFDDLKKVKLYTKTGDTISDTASDATISKDALIYVKYNTTLNSNAAIGLPGQTNAVTLTYSNNPNSGGEGETDTTPKDEVVVFTYGLDITKVDANSSAALTGAKFKIQDASETGGADSNDNKWAVLAKVEGKDGYYKVTSWTDDETSATEVENTTGNQFIILGLDSDAYNLKETAAPSGYTVPANAFSVTLTATTANNQNWDSFVASDALTALTVKVDNTEGTSEKYDETAVDGNSPLSTSQTSSENVDVGALTIKNSSSSTLPSTGGIGTTIFYVAGGVLVVGAGVLLITKKRAKDEQ